jgi:heme A synthase
MNNIVNHRYVRFAWGVLGLNVLVIIWGAFVRATGSGAGCGSNWPLCQGEVIPQPQQIETIIEFSHRVTSGLALLAVLALIVWGFRAYPKSHPVRKGVVWSGVFIILEALIGAALVLLEYTAFNVSVGRAIWMAGHLVNTFLLLAALALTIWWANGGDRLRLRGHGSTAWTYWLLVAGMFVLGASGAITALGDTLTITGGISPQENALVATFVDLRIFHPLIAFAVFGLALLAVWTANRDGKANADMQRYGQAIVILFIVQLLIGALNVQLKAPVWLQMVHLLFTSTIWVLVVLFGAATLSNRSAETVKPEPAYLKAGA